MAGLSLPLMNTIAQFPRWATDLRSGVFAAPLIGNGLLLNLFSVALLLGPRGAVLGLDSLVGDSALGSSHGLGDGGRSMGNSCTVSTIASLRCTIGDGGSQTGVSNKLV